MTVSTLEKLLRMSDWTRVRFTPLVDHVGLIPRRKHYACTVTPHQPEQCRARDHAHPSVQGEADSEGPGRPVSRHKLIDCDIIVLHV